jgi:hypothetical protein
MISTVARWSWQPSCCSNAARAKCYPPPRTGIFAQDALGLIDRSPIKRLYITDTLPVPQDGPTARIEIVSVAPLLAEAITRIHRTSVSARYSPDLEASHP